MHQYCTYILLLYTDLYSWVIQTLFGNVVQGNLSFSCVQCKECTCTLYSIYCMTYVSTVCTSHSSHTFNGTVQHTWPYLLFSYFVSESTSSCSQTRNENTATMEYPLIIHGTKKFPFCFRIYLSWSCTGTRIPPQWNNLFRNNTAWPAVSPILLKIFQSY